MRTACECLCFGEEAAMITPAQRKQIVSIIDDIDDMTIATVREDGFPQATTVSYVNDGLTIYFGTGAHAQKARNLARSDKVSLTINRPYKSWDEIEGVSVGGRAVKVSDQQEQQKVGALMFKKFPQIAKYADSPPDTELAIYRVDPIVISLLDYRKGFGHTELAEV
jgi:nitroimidazol reductase NimA-like FMN-containing flavoprotein (pyridoxamine 5'-phosphate oxidase superfamily)